MRDTAIPDEQLVSLSKDGNLGAFNSLVATYERQVFNLCLRLVGDAGAAEDATQEAFVSAFRSIHSFRGGNFRSWLFRIAANQAKDELRRRKRRPATTSLISDDDDKFEFEHPDPGKGPADHTENRELADALAAGLQGLPFEQRQVVLLIDYHGFDYAEAAEAADTSLGTIKSRLHRGRDALRQYVLANPELFGSRWRQD